MLVAMVVPLTNGAEVGEIDGVIEPPVGRTIPLPEGEIEPVGRTLPLEIEPPVGPTTAPPEPGAMMLPISMLMLMLTITVIFIKIPTAFGIVMTSYFCPGASGAFVFGTTMAVCVTVGVTG